MLGSFRGPEARLVEPGYVGDVEDGTCEHAPELPRDDDLSQLSPNSNIEGGSSTGFEGASSDGDVGKLSHNDDVAGPSRDDIDPDFEKRVAKKLKMW